jgi:hypothetical protein
MKLVDVRAKALALGIYLPGADEQFVIQCCGRTLGVDDPELLNTAVRNLKAYWRLS